MNAVGIIVEYNPLHNGHLIHLQKAKILSSADVVIAVMSGNFLQRGEPAIVDNLSRTKMALNAGVDIVIELPPAFSVQPADRFAKSAVSLLQNIGATSLVFGSENGNINEFIEYAKLFSSEGVAINAKIKENIKSGESYGAAFEKAVQTFSLNKQKLDLASPNNNLGFHYVNSVLNSKLNPNMKLYTFKRFGANFHDLLPKKEIASATAIRNHFFSHQTTTSKFIPSYVAKELFNKKLMQWENYWHLLRYKFLTMTPVQLRRIYEIKEGIENRLIHFAKLSSSFKQFISFVKTKRYTLTRLQRICTYVLLNIEKESVEKYRNINYLRLLGATSLGRQFLRYNKKNILLPVVTKISDYNTAVLQDNFRYSQIYYLTETRPKFAPPIFL